MYPGQGNDEAGLKPFGGFVSDSRSPSRGNIAFRKTMKVATWNVKSMYAGKLQEVAREMERLDIGVVGLSEVRWAGAGHFTAEGKHMMIYSGCPKTRQNGVGFLVHQSVSSSVAGYNPVSDRIAVLRLKGKPCGITVVQVYAPTTAAEDSEIEKVL